MDVDMEMPLPSVAWYHPTADGCVHGQPVDSPRLMDGTEERLMFYRYNYAKKRLTDLKHRVCREGLTAELAEQLAKWHCHYEHSREYLVRTNLALVLAMARRVRPSEVDFAEIISEGNMGLLNAVDKFDAGRGFKFSTYACRAILRTFGRAALKVQHHRARFPVELDASMEKSDWPERRRGIFKEECVDELKMVVDGNLANLTDVEQEVIRHRFNWQELADGPLTLDEVGRIIGVTKERVRQIQNIALGKIRQITEERIWGGAPTPSRRAAIPGFPSARRIQVGSPQQAKCL
ncbi:MAG: sigma-70 family RNA polymerase sigma factor [Tepidisphaeraceae bacterium]|jgi:RNA polymerase sigma factor (sigma-70 family)